MNFSEQEGTGMTFSESDGTGIRQPECRHDSSTRPNTFKLIISVILMSAIQFGYANTLYLYETNNEGVFSGHMITSQNHSYKVTGVFEKDAFMGLVDAFESHIDDQKSVNDGTGQKSVNDGTGQKSVNDGTGQKSVNDGTGQKSVNDGTGQKSVNDGTGQKSVNDGTGQKSVNDGTGQKSVNDGTGQKSVNDGTGGIISINYICSYNKFKGQIQTSNTIQSMAFESININNKALTCQYKTMATEPDFCTRCKR